MMKLPKISSVALVAIEAVVLFLILWYVWYSRYYDVLRWMEGYTWWSDLPDLVALSCSMPADALKVAGAFLMQFYYYPLLGAAIQSLLAVGVFLCGAVVVASVAKRSAMLMWLPLVPTGLFLGGQFWDNELTRSLAFLIVSILAALVVWLVSRKVKWRLSVPTVVVNGYVMAVLTVSLMIWNVWQLAFSNPANEVHAYYCRLENLATDRQWDQLLEQATPDMAQQNEIVRRFALLGLVAKGRLTQEMFLYGVTSSEDFIFKDRDEPLCRHFNALFYRTLNMPNEVIHQSFQQQVQSTFGISFGVLRQLAETHLEMKHYALAKKYLDILSHSIVMRHWANERKAQLEAIRTARLRYEQRLDQFYTVDLLVAMGAMADRYPQDHRYADVLLCGLLANKNGDDFYPAFKVVASRQYAHGEPIPAYYEQALMLVAPAEPEVMRLFTISQPTQQAFQQVMRVVESGQKAQLPALVPNTFWAYVF